MNEELVDFNVTDISFVVNRMRNPKWCVDYANKQYFIAVFALEGIAHYIVEDRPYTVNKGDLLFFQKGVYHVGKSDPDEPWTFVSVVFDIDCRNEESRNALQRIQNIKSTIHPVEYTSLFNELNSTWDIKKPAYLIKSRAILMQILYLMIHEHSMTAANVPHFQAIERLMNIIASDCTVTYSSEQLAELAGISPSYLRLLFKKITGFSVNQYQNYIRIHKARDLLLSGECNVTEASHRTGFNDIFYFSKMFKKMTGRPPSEYMRQTNGKHPDRL